MGKKTKLIFLVVALYQAATVTSERILFLMPLATRSETHLLNPLAQALLDRGHEVTLVSPATSSIKHKNLTEIIPVKPLDMSDFDPSHSNVLEKRKSKDSLANVYYVDLTYMFERCHATYQHEDFQPVLQAESYDLVLSSAFFTDCFLGLIYKVKAPFIQLSSMPPLKHVLDSTGLRTPLSFVPNPLIELTDRMTLSERIVNTLSSWSFSLLNHLKYFKASERVYQHYLGEDFPDVEVLRNNVSLIFTNTHFSINYPRPTLPDMVEIGGVHCRAPKVLPKDIEDFVSGDENGFIFFSMGTVFKEENMPESVKQIFINVFSRLKQRVLWKWNSDSLKNLPSNVKVSKWLPQQDVLGHPNIKLFISHGGLLSTQESTYHGVPVLGIPVFVDQDVNMRHAEDHGYALRLEILDLNEEMLQNAINRMLNESSFAENAKRASQIFRDQPQTPLERAIYWVEYVIKHKGAPQLRSAARDLTYFEYHLYDVQLILFGVVATIIVLVWNLISWMLGFREEPEKSKQKINSSRKKRQ